MLVFPDCPSHGGEGDRSWVGPPTPQPLWPEHRQPERGAHYRKTKLLLVGGVKRYTRERGCFSNSNINSSTVNTGIAFRWIMDIHIFVQFMPQSGCDKMSANASSEYNLAAAQSAFSLSQTPFDKKCVSRFLQSWKLLLAPVVCAFLHVALYTFHVQYK